MSLRAQVKSGVRSALYRSGALGAWHRRRHRHVLTVLMFHRVLPSDDPAFGLAEREFTFTLTGFARTLDFVQRHYNVVGLNELEAARQGRSELPRTPLMITFDDGWRDTLIHALPELKRRGLPAVLFVPSEVVTLDDERWWQDALVAVLRQPGAADRLCAAADLDEKRPGNVAHVLTAYLGAMPPAARRAWLEQHAPGLLSGVWTRQMVTLDELQAAHGPTLAVGGHGHTHSPLTLVANPASELQASQRMLDQLGQQPRSMSFPHGVWSEALVAQACAAGFQWVFTSQPELVDIPGGLRRSSPMGRIHVPEGAWTCTAGRIDPARLATFLFLRPIQHHRPRNHDS